MTSCPSTTRSVLTRTGALAVVFGTTFGLVLGPAGLALAQDAAVPSTVRAVIGADGAVTSIDRIGSDEAPGDLPVTLKIVDEGDTTSYTVENTTVQKQTVSYLGADGKPATAEQEVALPLVAQLSVRLPASRTGIDAPGARITKLADGSTELVWSMVLFGPIGSPVSDVSYTAVGAGEGVTRLDVAAVQPNATPGLSAVAQAANATVNGNGILNTVANGANEGLIKLSDGVGQLLAGLDKLYAGAQKLNTGIIAAADGANQLADGSEKAAAGSGELAKGLDTLAAGNTAAADGAKKLADGLSLISGGLEQLSAAQGLPAALDGAKKLQAGVDQLRAGVGDPAKEGTLLNGVAQIAAGLTATGGGLGQVKGGLDQLAAGLPVAKGGVDQVQKGLAGASADKGALDQLAALAALARAGIAGCAPGLPVPAPKTPCEGINTLAFGLSHPAGATGATDAGGLKQQLAAGAAGLGQISAGLGTAVGGVGQLQAGVTQLQAGNTALSAGVAKIDAGLKQVAGGLESGDATKPGVAEGLDALVAGLTKAVGGVGQLATGAKAASTGSTALATGTGQLAAGAGKAATGADALNAGINKIADGQRKVADGLPAAADGSGQLADGIGKVVDGEKKVATGLGDLRTKAVGVLSSQFTQGTELARQQLAGLDAASALIASTPGAATTTWVLTQSDGGEVKADLASDDSNLGRNAAIGAGGALLLMTGIAGGYLSGRRKTVV
jgi:putative membrane protein